MAIKTRVQFKVRGAEKGDGYELGPNLRQADKDEIFASTGVDDPAKNLESGLWNSDTCWTVTLEDEPIAIFGVTGDEDKTANVWMLGSDKIEDIRWQFLRESKTWLKKISKDYDMLWAFADARNIKHTDWYKWLGFEVTTTKPYGPMDLPFHRIVYLTGE